jgi:hypothetical protein
MYDVADDVSVVHVRELMVVLDPQHRDISVAPDIPVNTLLTTVVQCDAV